MFCLALVLLNLLLVLESNNCFTTEVQFERFEQQLGFHLTNFSGLRVRKFNRTTWILDGDGEIFVDLTDEYQAAVSVAYSALGNNQWNEYPMKVSKSKFCSFINGAYKEYQPYFIYSTNLPSVGVDWLCPVPKGRYWVRNFAPDGDWIPSSVPSGYWRFTGVLSNANDEILIKYIFFMRIKTGYL
ncbi:uncharacterized protein LOC131695400 [Topomyia yanbarensis]|uniref:uncharacterized protein LOC131695393 n=1 Tax=Topomyia yanbarensis TaxID=2498891 RepID=UPI00273C2EC3|nr:uncharacterized protein LOC131695393 [Topomyia yanbarensis]XP_058839868.1 uncharacterized protein LOC131695400 [Topomyia yanbarensis]